MLQTHGLTISAATYNNPVKDKLLNLLVKFISINRNQESWVDWKNIDESNYSHMHVIVASQYGA